MKKIKIFACPSSEEFTKEVCDILHLPLGQMDCFKFKNDNMLHTLEEALNEKQWEEAFRAAHSIKGVCANLGISQLEASSSDLTEALRDGEPKEDIAPLLGKVREDYELTMKVLDALE